MLKKEQVEAVKCAMDGIPPGHAVAMKADLAIPWEKLRTIRR